MAENVRDGLGEMQHHKGRVMATHPMESVHHTERGKHPVHTIKHRPRGEHEAPHHRPHEHGSHMNERGAGMSLGGDMGDDVKE